MAERPAGVTRRLWARHVAPPSRVLHDALIKTSGTRGFDYATDDQAAALRPRGFHAACGITTSSAILVAAPVDVICCQLHCLADLVDDGHVAGLHGRPVLP